MTTAPVSQMPQLPTDKPLQPTTPAAPDLSPVRKWAAAEETRRKALELKVADLHLQVQDLVGTLKGQADEIGKLRDVVATQANDLRELKVSKNQWWKRWVDSVNDNLDAVRRKVGLPTSTDSSSSASSPIRNAAPEASGPAVAGSSP